MTTRTPLQPTIEVHGPAATHDMPCCVFREEHAVLNLDDGTFHPSWRAQAKGYRLVKAKTRLQKLAIRWLFND